MQKFRNLEGCGGLHEISILLQTCIRLYAFDKSAIHAWI
jgi:hypothetical protein